MSVENSLTHVFTQVSTAYRNRLQKQMNVIDLHSGQIFILFSLWEKDGQSQIELVKELNLTPPTVYKMVDSLMRNGFVKSEKCEEDKRLMRVYLTEKGRQSKEAVEDQMSLLEAVFFSGLNETEKLILMQILGKLKESITNPFATSPNGL
jgi:DNA-binding MarR family transcriptional regulator